MTAFGRFLLYNGDAMDIFTVTLIVLMLGTLAIFIALEINERKK